MSLVKTRIVHIRIEARIGDDEIAGQVGSDTGPSGSFRGWLGLISALDSLLSVGVRSTGARPNSADVPGTTEEGRDK